MDVSVWFGSPGGGGEEATRPEEREVNNTIGEHKRRWKRWEERAVEKEGMLKRSEELKKTTGDDFRSSHRLLRWFDNLAQFKTQRITGCGRYKMKGRNTDREKKGELRVGTSESDGGKTERPQPISKCNLDISERERERERARERESESESERERGPAMKNMAGREAKTGGGEGKKKEKRGMSQEG